MAEDTAIVEVRSVLQNSVVRPETVWKNDAISMYGIDSADPAKPTAKEKVHATLSSLADSSGGEQDVKKTFDDLLAAGGKGERVGLGDLVATHDALTLRIDDLKSKGTGIADQKIFANERENLETYLQGREGVDLSSEATNERLGEVAGELQKNYRGFRPEETSNGYKQLVRRAAVLQVYGGEPVKAELVGVRERMSSYPVGSKEFRQRMVRETLYGESESSDEMRRKSMEEVLAGYKYEAEVRSEVQAAAEEVKALGVTGVESAYLLGSAARMELRTKEDNPEDPSDIDMLVVVSEDDMNKLAKLMNDPTVRLSRSKTVAGATFFLVKRQSVTGKFADTEMVVCSREGLQKQLNGPENEDRTKFVRAVRDQGLLIRDF